MDIHKPKAAHSWREFLIELGTVICGILIALGLEQGVEQLHWSHSVHAEREALSSELSENLKAVAFRIDEEACIDRRLTELQKVFALQAHGKPVTITGHVGRPSLWLGSQNTWQIALSDQSLAHMSLKDRLSLSEAFDDYKAFNELREQEDAVWRRLSLLDRPEDLTPADWPLLRQAYGEALGMSDRLRLKMVYMAKNYRFGEQLKLPAIGPDQEQVERSFCSAVEVG